MPSRSQRHASGRSRTGDSGRSHQGASGGDEPFRTVVLGRAEWPPGFHPLDADADLSVAETDHTGALGFVWPAQAETCECEVAIIGGGPSGLIAAYRLRDLDVLLLEREPEVGGNSRADAARGITYPAGAIVTYARSPAMELYDELGLSPVAVESAVRSAVVLDGRRLEGDLWESLPETVYGSAAVRSFLQARDDLLALDVEAERERLDGLRLSELLVPYRPEVKHWLDRLLGWFACGTDDVSAYAGAYMARSQMGEGLGVLYPERTSEGGAFSFEGGLSHAAIALRHAFETAGRGRTWTETTVLGVRQDDQGVTVRAVRRARPVLVRARIAIVAASKHIARRIVAGLPADQRAAMEAMAYVPYLVGSVVSSGPLAADLPVARTLDAPMATLRQVGSAADGHLLRFEAPLRPGDRPFRLDEESLGEHARRIAAHLERLFPGAREKIEEIRIWRRGHNWYVPGPGFVTRHQPVAARPLGRVLFANADSLGPISEFGWALVAGERAAEAALDRLATEDGRRRVPRPTPIKEGREP